jgi:HEAT repeat protein
LFTLQKIWIYLISADDQLPFCTFEGICDQKRIDHYKKEIQNAIHHYHVIPKDKLNYQKAVLEYPKPKWRQPFDAADNLPKNVNTQKPELIQPEIKGIIYEGSPIGRVILNLASEDPEIRCNAAAKITESRIVGSEVVSHRVLQNGSAISSVKKILEFVIPRYEARKAIPALLNILNDSDANVRKGVAEALDSLDWSPQSEMERIPYFYAKQDWTELSKSGDSAVDYLILRLQSDEEEIQSAVARTLADIGSIRAVDPIIHALRGKSKKTRRSAAFALGKIGDKKSVEPLIQALKDEEMEVRLESALALGKIQDHKAIDPLCIALCDSEESVRRAAAELLAGFNDPRSIEPLKQLLQDKNNGVRVAANNSLAILTSKVGSEMDVGFYIQLLSDKDPDIRRTAVESLSTLKKLDSIDPLLKSLWDTNFSVRMAAAKALGEIGDPKAIDPLIESLKDTSLDVKASSAIALCKLHDSRSFNGIISNLLSADDSRVRKIGAHALGYANGEHVIQSLIAALKDTSKDVRITAAESLGNIGDDSAIEPLIQSLKDNNWVVRKTVITALGKIGDKRAVEPLRQLVEIEEDDEVRHIGEQTIKSFQPE